MRVLVLGAGQDVGKSCVVVRFGGKTFMLDCGMHLGYQDERRFPDFSLLSPSGDFNTVIDAVFITHFHLDHLGALPFFTEVCGYHGPIYMTYPTRAIAPLMLEDYHRVLLDRPGTGPVFSKAHIAACMAKVQLLDLQESVQVFEGCEVTAYNAGHVLGAAILHLKVGSQSIVYTGDFSTVPDRHLSGACVPKLAPDLLISESTYATSIRESKVARESSLMAAIHEAVLAGGKVLIPVFAVGRAQELLLLLDEFWERTQLNVPIYFSGPMAARANQYYKLLLNWASERVKQGPAGTRATALGFGRVQPWQQELMHQPGACVLFATPGMLQGGTSLEVFKAWAPNPKNLVLLPSYQVAGTLGRKLMLGQRKGILVDKANMDINCKVHYASVSAHADAKGILQLLQQVAPAAAMLVHGEPDKMAFMSSKIESSFGIKCFMPANGEEVEITSQGCGAVPTAACLLRKLPMAVEQLLQTCSSAQLAPVLQGGSSAAAATADAATGGARGGFGCKQQSAGAAAASWLQQGDVGQLVQAAMKLAGLNTPATRMCAAAVRGNSSRSASSKDTWQQDGQQQLPALPAAVQAAQLAPWLELLAAAAQEVQQHALAEQQQALQAQLQQQVGPQEQKQPVAAAAALSGRVASLSQQLRQQLMLESQSCVLDGILVVKHLPPPCPADQPLVQSMQLLPAEDAAASAGLPHHKLRLRCKLQLPERYWHQQQQQNVQRQQQHSIVQAAQQQQVAQQQLDTGQGEASSQVVLQRIAGVLRNGLPDADAQQVHMDGSTVRVRSVRVKAPNTPQSVGVVCWLLQDDSLAQQCISLLTAGT